MNNITNKIKLIREEKIFNTLQFIEAAEQHGILVGLLLVDEEQTKITTLGTEKFVYKTPPIMQYVIHHESSGRPKQHLLKYANIIKEKYQGSGQVVEIPMYYLIDKTVESYDTAAIDVRLSGDEISSLIKTEDSQNYRLEYLPIRRGTIMFLPQDFFTPSAGKISVDSRNMYYISEVYIDIDAISYECIVVPYKTSIAEHNISINLETGQVSMEPFDVVEKDNEGNVKSFINFDNNKHGL